MIFCFGIFFRVANVSFVKQQTCLHCIAPRSLANQTTTRINRLLLFLFLRACTNAYEQASNNEDHSQPHRGIGNRRQSIPPRTSRRMETESLRPGILRRQDAGRPAPLEQDPGPQRDFHGFHNHCEQQQQQHFIGGGPQMAAPDLRRRLL